MYPTARRSRETEREKKGGGVPRPAVYIINKEWRERGRKRGGRAGKKKRG